MTLQGVAFEYMYSGTLKVLSNGNRDGSKLVSIHPFYPFYELSGRQVAFPGPNGRHHERSMFSAALVHFDAILAGRVSNISQRPNIFVDFCYSVGWH
jgi:hypothetical protein